MTNYRLFANFSSDSGRSWLPHPSNDEPIIGHRTNPNDATFMPHPTNDDAQVVPHSTNTITEDEAIDDGEEDAEEAA